MVGDVIMKWKQSRPGRQHFMTNRDHQALKQEIHETRQTSSETITCEFRSAMNCEASTVTVQRELRGMEFHG
jgi:hypothetical protein